MHLQSLSGGFFEILQFVAYSGGFAFQHQRSLLSVNKLPLAIINLKGNEDQSSTLKNKKKHYLRSETLMQKSLH